MIETNLDHFLGGEKKLKTHLAGKGKSRPPSGPTLSRARVTSEPVTGEVTEWKGGKVEQVVRGMIQAFQFRPENLSFKMLELLGTGFVTRMI